MNVSSTSLLAELTRTEYHRDSNGTTTSLFNQADTFLGVLLLLFQMCEKNVGPFLGEA